MDTHCAVMERWDSPTDLANDIGMSPITVRSWKYRNKIPVEHWPAIVEAAKKRGFVVTADELAGISKDDAA